MTEVQFLHLSGFLYRSSSFSLTPQVNSAFVRTAMQAAETVVDGFVEPVNGNPEDPAFLWSGLFMSQGATGPVFGGERGRR